ncbi:hypothetical protein [Paenibacillus polymyxa]|uniref:hypothetical protein n=1 Tax=Paenibacillus polymyxa TaxID=1406 RepID=UPI0004162515|nr:hypothetical protein [Paenibacillus polymyxa]
MKTYITIGYFENGSEIVYAGEDEQVAMETNLYPEYHAVNVVVWEGGEVIQTRYKGADSEWEYFK